MPIVVITGASQGIGAAVAEAFARKERTARLALVARSKGKLEAIAERCRTPPGNATGGHDTAAFPRGTSGGAAAAEAFPCDVTDDEAVFETAEAIEERWGTPDVVVSNAGLFKPGPLAEISPEQFRQQVAVNLTSAFIVTKAFLEGMVRRGSGHLFYMASIAALQAYPGGAAYGAAKAGLRGLARTVREETKSTGLRVTTLLPGATRTPSWDGTDLPDSRFMPPEDVAETLLSAYRLSDRSVLEEVVLRPQKGDL